MTALTPPPADAPASEWGLFAVSILRWRWPWTCTDTEVCPPMPGYVWLEGAWCYTDDITPAARFSRIRAIPDPDHWAWEGWLWRLIAPGWRHTMACDLLRPAPTLGRACIAAAADLCIWPGGEK